MAIPLASETFWFNKYQCEDAECAYQEHLSGVKPVKGQSGKTPPSDLVNQIAKAREQIQKSLDNPGSSAVSGAVEARLAKLEQENKELRQVTQDLQSMLKKLEIRVGSLQGTAPPKQAEEKKDEEKPAAKESASEDEEDDDFELFGSDSDDEEAERVKEQRLKEYQDKKSQKKAVIAKSSIVMDVKTWGDEVDIKEVEKMVRAIEMDGLVWGASKVLPVAFGVKKLQIICVIEDDKVSTDDLQEQIEEFEDHVQSTDIVAFNKI